MVDNIQLSKNICLYDYLKSNTAERYPLVLDQQYNPPAKLIENAKRFATEIDQPIIDLWGDHINKTSTYRCPDFKDKAGIDLKGLNSLVGGSLIPLSAHCTLRAGDREPYWNGKEADGITYKRFCEMILNNKIPFDKMILEYGEENCPAWVHLQINEVTGAQRGLVFRVGRFTDFKYIPFNVHDWFPTA